MRRLAVLGVALLVAACGGSTAPSPSGSAAASSGAPSPSASPSAVVSGLVFRAWSTQALPPAATFTWGSTALIADGKVYTPGAMIMIYPGPLLAPVNVRSITPTGVSRIFEAAQAAGLLAGPTDLTGGIPPGGMTAHLLFVLDGQEREVVGDPNKVIMCIKAPCIAPAGSPEAFGQFWSQVNDLTSLAGTELGQDATYTPERLALLITDPTPADPAVPPAIAQWPLATALREFGTALGGGTDRCGVVEGADLAKLLPAVQEANALTQWTDGTTGGRQLVVRTLLPGEPSPC